MKKVRISRFVFLTVLSLLLISFSFALIFRNSSLVSAVSSPIRSFVFRIDYLVSAPFRAIDSMNEEVKNLFDIYAENKRLKKKVAELEDQSDLVSSLKEENEKLKKANEELAKLWNDANRKLWCNNESARQLRKLSEDMADIPKATRSSFRTMPLPERRESLKMSLQYGRHDYNKIRAGLVPNNMDDRWFIFFEDGWLYVYRSWSGFCVYGACFEDTPTGGFLSKAWVNANKEQYNLSDPKEEAQLLETLIAELLLTRHR